MNHSNQNAFEKYLRLRDVLKIVPVSRSTWYRGVNSGLYPKPVKLSHRATAWRMADVTRCLEALQKSEGF